MTDKPQAILMGFVGDYSWQGYILYGCNSQTEFITVADGGGKKNWLFDAGVLIRKDWDVPREINFLRDDDNKSNLTLHDYIAQPGEINYILDAIETAKSRIVISTSDKTFTISAKGSTAAYNKVKPVCDELRRGRS